MRSRLVLLGGQTLALGLLEAFLVVPASALFLSTYGAHRLPWAYIVVAIAGILISALVTRWSRTMSLGRLAGSLVTAYILIVTFCWLALYLWGVTEATFVLIVLFPLSIPIGFVIVGSQAVRLYDVRELKAQFPRAVAGFPAGFALGGLAAGVLAGVFGDIVHLLLVGVLCALGMLGLILYTAREFPAELLTRPQPSPAPAPDESTARQSRWTSLRDPLVIGVLAYQLLSGSVTQLLDYMVWERAAAAFPEPAPLARFQGFYGAALNITSILFVFLIASWLLRRYGVRIGLAANPALIIVACLVLVTLGHGAGIVGVGFLAAACVAQVADITTTDGLTRTSVAATYQALPPDRRLRTQAIAEGAGTPVAIGLAGVLLLLVQAMGLSVLAVAWLVLAMSVVWLALAVTTYRSYAQHLADVLRHGAWDPRALRVDGPAGEAAVRRLLQSPDAQERVTGLEALADSGSTALDAELARALHDDDVRVRLLAVDLVGRDDLARRSVRDALVHLLDETPAGVRAAAALVGGGDDAAARSLRIWAEAVTGQDHVLAVAAISGAARAPHPAHLPLLLEVAGRPDPPLAIVEALATHVDRLGAPLSSLWHLPAEGSDTDGRRRTMVVRAVAGAGRSAPRAWLLAQLDDANLTRSDLRLIVDGVRPRSWTRRPCTVPAATVSGRIEQEAARLLAALHGLAQLEGLGADPRDAPADGADVGLGLTIAREAFRDEVREAQRHVEILFGASAAPRGTAWFLRALAGDDPALRAAAIELAEATFGRRRGLLIIAVLDPTVDDLARIRTLEAVGLSPSSVASDPASWLADVALDATGAWDSPWLQASVLRALPHVSSDLADEVAAQLSSRAGIDPVLAETAAWARG